MVQSSEDWQAAFGFQPESSRTNHAVQKSSPSSSPGVTFNSEGFVDEEAYTNLQYATLSEPSGTFTPNMLVNSPASKFMADFQQNSLQQRLALQVNGIKQLFIHLSIKLLTYPEYCETIKDKK